MNENMKRTILPALGALGLLAMGLRWGCYAFAEDAAGLLIPGHPLMWCLRAVVILAVGMCLAVPWKLDGSGMLEDNLIPGKPDFLGHWAAATGIAMTVLLNEPMGPGRIGQLWQVTGYLSVAVLVLGGIARLNGEKPSFLCHGVPCFFFLIHLVNHYQYWCSRPQFADYGYALFAAVCSCLFAYHRTALDVDIGKRRMLLGFGLMTLFLCGMEIGVSRYPWMHLGNALWAGATLLSMKPPVPKKVPPKQPPKEKEA